MDVSNRQAAEGYEELYKPADIKTIKDIENAFDNIHRKLVQKNSKISIQDKQNILNDFQLFCKTYLPHVYSNHEGIFTPFHPVMIDYINEIISNPINSLTQLRLPRGWGKSSLLFGFIIFMIIKKEYKYLLYISNSVKFSVECIYDIRLEFITNDKLIADFGTFNIKSIGNGDFEITNENLGLESRIEAHSVGSQIRGRLWRHTRPNLICDDLEDEELTRSEERENKLEVWFNSELYRCVDINRYRITIVGNRFADNMLLDKVAKRANCKTFILRALENNKSTWESRFSTELLLGERANGPQLFDKEMNHEPLAGSNHFPIELLSWGNIDYKHYGRTVAWYDGSYSISGDYKSCVILTRIKFPNQDPFWYVDSIYCRQGTTQAAIIWMTEQYRRLNNNNIPVTIYYDSTFFQGELMIKDQRDAERQTGQMLPMVGRDEKRNKIQKIEMLIGHWYRKLITFNNNIEETFDWLECKKELANWTPKNSTAKSKDDFLDSLISCCVENDLMMDSNQQPLTIERNTDNFIF